MQPTHAYLPLQWFGNLLAGVRFNSVTPVETAGAQHFRKSRFRSASALVPLANWYAARIGMNMRVLGHSAWLRYEPLMYRHLLGISVPARNGTILVPRLPGRSLLSFLQKDHRLSRDGELGLRLAVTELARLHACWTPHPWRGGLQRFSHADATIQNVLVDTERERAHWIDFETTHAPSLPAPVRHADDLLTLLCGAAAEIEQEEWPRVCELLLGSYKSRPVTDAMVNLLRSWEKRPPARQLAIPMLKDRQWRLLCQMTLAAAGEPVR